MLSHPTHLREELKEFWRKLEVVVLAARVELVVARHSENGQDCLHRDETQTGDSLERDPATVLTSCGNQGKAWVQVLRSLQARPVVHGVVIYPSIALSPLGSNHQAVGSAGRCEIRRQDAFHLS